MSLKSINIKKVTTELIVFGFVVILSSSALAKCISKYTPTTLSIDGDLRLAMIKVPVPIEKDMEGKQVDFVVRCGMKKGVLECSEAR